MRALPGKRVERGGWLVVAGTVSEPAPQSIDLGKLSGPECRNGDAIMKTGWLAPSSRKEVQSVEWLATPWKDAELRAFTCSAHEEGTTLSQ